MDAYTARIKAQSLRMSEERIAKGVGDFEDYERVARNDVHDWLLSLVFGLLVFGMIVVFPIVIMLADFWIGLMIIIPLWTPTIATQIVTRYRMWKDKNISNVEPHNS